MTIRRIAIAGQTSDGGGDYTDEQARDAVGAALVGGSHIGVTVDDTGNAITVAVTGLATVATSGSASDITTGTLPDSVIPSGIARDSEVAAAVAALVNSAPGTLDTLGEIATQLATDESAAAALATTVSGKAAKSANLSDLADASTARTNLGLGNVATRAVGTTTGTAATGDDSRFTDTRTPTDATVTNAKVASGAAISADKLADGTTLKVLTATERTKLSGIASGATANSSDATLLARAAGIALILGS